MNKLIYLPLIIVAILLGSCTKEPTDLDGLLDGDIIMDASLYAPEDYLISVKYPNPSVDDLNKHILIAIHGFSASTFEWQEFQDYSDTLGPYRVSQVLLDGHGRTYEDFKNSTWKDWSQAIKREYEKLEELGYTKISLVGSSTGGPLILELVSSGYFESHTNPKYIFLIDPIIVSSIKIQSIAGLIGPMLGYVEAENSGDEVKYWYTYRPQETVRELNALMKAVRKDLEKGITLPSNTYLKSFHSDKDPTANSASTVLIYKGVTSSNGNHIDAEIIDSEIHVFTRLALREGITQKDIANQQKAFEEMATKLSK